MLQYISAGNIDFSAWKFVLSFIDPHGSGICPHLWFLPTLWIMSLFIPLFKLLKRENAKLIILVVAFLLLFLPDITSWFCLNELRIYSFFFILGYFCGGRTFDFIKPQKKAISCAVGFVLCVVFIIFRNALIFSRVFITLSGFVIIIFGSQLIGERFRAVNGYLGKYTFVIYLLSLCIQNFGEVICALMNINWWIAAMLMFVTGLVVPVLIGMILYAVNKKKNIKYLLILFGLR